MVSVIDQAEPKRRIDEFTAAIEQRHETNQDDRREDDAKQTKDEALERKVRGVALLLVGAGRGAEAGLMTYCKGLRKASTARDFSGSFKSSM